MTKDNLTIFVISDSVGETALKVAQAVSAQFPNLKTIYCRFPFIRSQHALEHVLKQAVIEDAFVIHTLVSDELSHFTDDFCIRNGVEYTNILHSMLKKIMESTGQQPTHQPGALHQMNDTYFDRISAMEFAVTYDDGKDPNGFLQADIVLLGISRTSKTPLSLFLANRNLKVANLPLIPAAKIPEQLWQVDPKKIVGLTNDPEILNRIRRERMIAYGLNPDTAYSNMDKINQEITYADDLYTKLGCLVINVANKSIEETAAIILENFGLDNYGFTQGTH